MAPTPHGGVPTTFYSVLACTACFHNTEFLSIYAPSIALQDAAMLSSSRRLCSSECVHRPSPPLCASATRVQNLRRCPGVRAAAGRFATQPRSSGHSRTTHSQQIARGVPPGRRQKTPTERTTAAPDADDLAEAASAASVAEDVEALSDAELGDELQELRARAAAAETSLKTTEEALQLQRDKFLRLNADWENYRKRTAAEQLRIRAEVKGDVVTQLLPLVDSFELARGQLQPQTDGEQKIDSAYQGVYKQMVELMKAVGVSAVPGEGSAFDPNVHDAIMREPSADVPDSTVLQVLRRGFTLGEKLIRPAMVKVSFSEAPAAPIGNGAPLADTDRDAFEDIVAADAS